MSTTPVASGRARLRREWNGQVGKASWKDTGYVFTTEIGTPIEPDNLRRSWYPLRAAAGLDGVRLHDLRHSCVTLLLGLKVPRTSCRRSSGTPTWT